MHSVGAADASGFSAGTGEVEDIVSFCKYVE